MPEEKKEKIVGKCEGCGAPLTAYVVSNGKRFCGDPCVEEFLTKKK